MSRARLALVLLAASAVAAATAQSAAALEVETMPATPGVRFSYQGVDLVSDARGRVDVPAATLRDARAGLRMQRTTLRNGVHAWPAGWRHGRVTVRVHHRVRLRFADPDGRRVAPSRIASVTLKAPNGARRVLRPEGAHWLPGNRILTLGRRTVSRRAVWAVERVEAAGVNVVARAQQRFAPERERSPRIVVRFHTLRFAARDALLGSAIGSDIRLRHPGGRVTRHPLRDGRVVLAGLPAGAYEVRVTARSLASKWPVALTRDEDVEVSVISYADVTIVLGALALLAAALVLVGRPRVRARLRRRAAA
jgi:hypothetical protein